MKRWLFILLLLLLMGCGRTDNVETKFPTVLADLSYEEGSQYGCRIYLPEDGEYVPYLVLTQKYGGHCLLLREHLMEESQIYNRDVDHAAYYENSEIDRYLSNSFEERFPSEIVALLESVDIVITAWESLESCGDEVVTIRRRVFLLSYAELGHTRFRSFVKEGEPLSYFSNPDRRIACYADGTPGSWWLRTPDTTDLSIVCGIGPGGSVGSGSVMNIAGLAKNGVRPALCIDGDAAVQTLDWNDRQIFVLAAADTAE